MKKLLIIPLLLTAVVLAACNTQTAPAAIGTDEPVPVTEANAVPEPAAPESAPAAQTVEDSLAYVREEEKLAHDVYVFLYEQWGVQVFQNISESEQVHTDTVKSLLAAYGLPDPAADLGTGQFSNPDLQALYNQLTVQGGQSLTDALKVGAAIEEIDILDLQSRLQSNLPDDVRLAYENLLSGSFNHLAAFTSALERRTGEIYEPQYLTAEAYAEALSLTSAGGNGGGNGYRGGRP